jgi:4-hydroxy-3-polyprenylbenzoate decarboxylase
MDYMAEKKIAVAITGASGSIYAKRFLNLLNQVENIEISLVISKNAKEVWEWELKEKMNIQESIRVYDVMDYFAPFASGSSKYEALVIIPCSMGTIGRIAHGLSDDLITRAADVMLKEKRKLICVIRETPLSLIHLKNLVQISEAGGIVLPASPSFYSHPQNIEQLVDTVIHRIFDHLHIKVEAYRWCE